MSEWKTVSIRQELIKEIEKLIKTGRYRSISEFVSEAIRLRLEEAARTEATSTQKSQEMSITEDRAVKATPNLKEEEKAYNSKPVSFEETQIQIYRSQA